MAWYAARARSSNCLCQSDPSNLRQPYRLSRSRRGVRSRAWKGESGSEAIVDARVQRVAPVLHVEPGVLALVGKGGIGREDAAFCRADVVRCGREEEGRGQPSFARASTGVRARRTKDDVDGELQGSKEGRVSVIRKSRRCQRERERRGGTDRAHALLHAAHLFREPDLLFLHLVGGIVGLCGVRAAVRRESERRER